MFMDVLEAILTRRSPGKLGDPGPNNEQLTRILEAAVHAPDHGRLSPWRFAVLRDARRQLLADALGELLTRKHADVTADMLATEKAKAFRAPVIVAVAAHTVSGHKVPEVEQLLAVGAAVQNMLLAAAALGFGALWKTGAAAYDADVKSALGFSANDQIVGFIYLGTAQSPAKPREFSVASHVRHL